MIWLFWLALLSWVVVLAFMTPAVWSIYVSLGRRGDPARLVCFAFALLMIGFLGRRVIIQDFTGDWFLISLLIGAVAVAALTLHVALHYGRGPRV